MNFQHDSRFGFATPNHIAGLEKLFNGDRFRFQFGMRRGGSDWFQLVSPTSPILKERVCWLRDRREECCVWTEAAAPVLAEALELFPNLPPSVREASSGMESCVALSTLWEPDFLLLHRDATDPEFRLTGGCVCFPSAWRVTEKLGRPVSEIHGPVPTLNQDLGSRITAFMSRLPPGEIYERENWGLAAVGDLNHHPDHGFPMLGSHTPLEKVWLRVEYQGFRALPKSNGILFIIRLVVYHLLEVLRNDAVRVGFKRMLETMPGDIARYKGIESAREQLLAQIGNGSNTNATEPAIPSAGNTPDGLGLGGRSGAV